MGYREPEMDLTQARRRWTSGGKIIATLSVFGLILSGCGKGSGSAVKSAAIAPVDQWVISDVSAANLNPCLLWNGLIGMRFLPRGDREIYLVDNYDQSGEEKIRKWSDQNFAKFMVGSSFITPVTGSDFKQSLDLKSGVYSAQWLGEDKLAGKYLVKCKASISPNDAVINESWEISTEEVCEIAASRSRPSAGPARQITGIYQNEYDLDANGKTLIVRERVDGSKSTGWNPDAGYSFRGQTTNRTPFVFQRNIIDTSGKTLSSAAGYDKSDFTKDWSNFWKNDIEIDGPVEDQQFIRSALFYLRSSIHPGGKMSVSPMGLSSDIYNGHVFWDADIWVFPALALIDPERAKAIPAYRLEKTMQARMNAVDWYQSGLPDASGPRTSDPSQIGPPVSIKFPWESSVTGKETVPGPSKYQDHITGSVVWSTQQASSLDLIQDNKARELLAMAAGFYGLRSHKVGNLREIHNTMSPDEHHIGDNDLYTNLLAMWVTNNGKWPNPPTYKLPQDPATKQPSNQATPIFLTYDNDPVRGYKQAAAVLSIYPLQYPPAEKQARQMMERFADKVTKNGPAMTDSIHSIIWARLGEKDKAYKAWHDSWKPFVKPPFLLFSEKRNSSRTYFTTGAAGSIQAVLYGFAGIRIDSKKAPNAQWSIPLKNGQILSIAPNLPKEWKKLTLKNLTILGKKYTFEIANDKVKVTEGS